MDAALIQAFRVMFDVIASLGWSLVLIIMIVGIVAYHFLLAVLNLLLLAGDTVTRQRLRRAARRDRL